MTLRFGKDTVTVTRFQDMPGGVPDDYGMIPQQETTVTVSGCRHRTLSVAELAEYEVNIGEEKWKTTCPPDAVFHTLSPGATITVNGRDYVIDSAPKHHGDFTAEFKVTIISTRKQG